MIAVVDYGVGNLYSLTCSLRHIGADCIVTNDEQMLRDADRIILPGVGAFDDAANKLRSLKMDQLLSELVIKKGKPLMGICLGMQLLFEQSLEFGVHQGLGFIGGTIRPLSDALTNQAKVPHMGWNSLAFVKANDPLLQETKEGDFVYYVHSYYATDCESSLVATSNYCGVQVPGVVRHANVCGTQFHPEKSGEIGLRMLHVFAAEKD
ncbi:MAG: imidazole glycerol phosphate synthase subunit HisH [Clostridiales bacterium]|nr:imidazole glycerol phosphate synthase subunit HisH [Clostridiales bacterium]